MQLRNRSLLKKPQTSFELLSELQSRTRTRSSRITERDVTVRRQTRTPIASFPDRKLKKGQTNGKNVCGQAKQETPLHAIDDLLASLHASNVPEALPCREKQFDQIKNFLHCNVKAKLGGCIYISGVPGTGKTATVYKAIEWSRSKLNFQFCPINGMELPDAQMIYVKIAQRLKRSWQSKCPKKAQQFLDRTFRQGNQGAPVVLLLDEIDLLIAKRQSALYQIFDWSCCEEAKLIVLAIANTLDFPERYLIKRVSSRVGLTRLCFEPYSYKEIETILSTRLMSCPLIAKDAVQLISRKVASVSGDARRALQLCRAAVELFVPQLELPSAKKSPNALSLTHVNEALKQITNSPKFLFVRNASVQQQLLLKAALNEYSRTGVEEFAYKTLLDQYKSLCSNEGYDTMTNEAARCTLQSLVSAAILAAQPGSGGAQQLLRFNVHPEEIAQALRN